MFGHSQPVRVDAFPGCTYCQPQVASIGLTEEKAKEDGIEYKFGKFPFAASGKAVAVNHSEGFVKGNCWQEIRRYFRGSHYWIGCYRVNHGVWISDETGSHRR
jgi:pyruvate/2-oxoglutarate dehydrogenase complex dihydrolipoamide dehydrogenase (E3) component